MSWDAVYPVSLINIYGPLGWLWRCRDEHTHDCSRGAQSGRTDRPQSSSVGYPGAPLEATSRLLSGRVCFLGFSSLRHLTHLCRVTYMVLPVLIRLPALQGAAQFPGCSPLSAEVLIPATPSALGEFPRCLAASAQLPAGGIAGPSQAHR